MRAAPQRRAGFRPTNVGGENFRARLLVAVATAAVTLPSVTGGPNPPTAKSAENQAENKSRISRAESPAAGGARPGEIPQGQRNRDSRPADPKQRFLDEAPKKWIAYIRAVTRRVEGTYKSASYDLLRSRKAIDRSENSFIIDFDENCVKDLDIVPPVPDKRECTVLNPRYKFTVLAGRNDQWTIEKLGWVRAPAIPADLIDGKPAKSLPSNGALLGPLLGTVCAGELLGAEWLPQLVAAPKFHLVRVTNLADDGQLVRVEFKYEKNANGAPILKSGAILLDAKRSWLIKEADVTLIDARQRATFRLRNEFTDGRMPVSFVSHTVCQMRAPNNAAGEHVETEAEMFLDMHEAKDIDPKQFTLSAFGLPEPREEPGAVAPRGTSPLLRITIAAVTLIGILLLGRILLRRRAAKTGP
jgi:hypothetical protein